ncbi:MAG: cyclase family protein [Bacteroidota bacterium]
MKIKIYLGETECQIDLNSPIDISIPLLSGPDTVNAWYCEPLRIEPVVMGDWIGDVSKGGSVNFRNVFLNPHGNGTHTECMGHISKELHSLNRELTTFFSFCSVVSIAPEPLGHDHVITEDRLRVSHIHPEAEAVAIRTLPNGDEKVRRHYSNTNPPYMAADAVRYLVDRGIKHLLIDLPSIDRERDEGALAAHHVFWNYPEAPRHGTTISEFIFIPDNVPDGLYLLNLMITSLENDASPSKPILYQINELG